MKTNVHVIITGKVQGVWFRDSTRQKAEQLGITGWVRNTRDRKVEAVFEGEKDRVDTMINWCHQGPPLANVDEVYVEEQKSPDELEDFSIKY